MKIIRTSKFWSVHTHSKYSVNDALPDVKEIVSRVTEMNQPALGLTDHGNMAGSVQLYQECMKQGIKPFPGTEAYFVPDLSQFKQDYATKGKKAVTYHLGLVAYDTVGYENLVAISTLSHQNFFHKPRLDFAMLAQMAEEGKTQGIAVTTGCYFGYAAQMLVHRGEAAAKQYLATLESWFPRSVYVEIQNHWIDHGDGWNDDKVADALVAIAEEMGLPVVITQDSHYVDPADRDDHESLKRLVAFGSDPDDAVFPGDGFHLADDQWIADHHSPMRLARGLEGLGDLLGRHRLSLPVLDSYSYSVPAVVKDPQWVMENRCVASLEAKGLNNNKYREQLQEEFGVIRDSGMAGYMLLVAQVTDWMRSENIIFQTRGSAAGSLVCWLLGISSVDPLKWSLRFDRFLSRDRTKPPDIDLDIAHDRRDDVIAWLNTKFTAHQIGSWAVYDLSDEQDDEFGEETKGSLKVRYFSLINKTLKEGEEKPKWIDVPREHRRMLKALADRKLYKGMGTNAAGVVITSNAQEFDRLVPMAYMASRDGYVSQYAKDDIEALGLVKLDVLGSKTLTVIDKCMANLQLSNDRLEDIEFNDRPTFNLIKSGETAGVFQLEGNTSKWGCVDLKPNHIRDVIAAMALFRPGAMNSGGTKAFIRRKHKKEPVPERHKLISDVTKTTYGIMLYQEQVIDVLRGLGMGADDLTKFLKAVKQSNKEVSKAVETMRGYQAWITARCDEMGMSREDKEFLNDAIAGFAEYGFNRAHATVYGITAYRCAYLAARHPVEFHAALLAVAAGSKKEDGYLRVTRRRGVKVLRPHVNVSGFSYTVDRERYVVRKGLLSVTGVGEKSASVLAALAPYADLDDLVERTPAKPVSRGQDYDGTPESLIGVLGALRDAGALSGLSVRPVRGEGSR